MVNRTLRDNAAALIRRYLASEITNFDFIEEFPQDKADAALKAIELRLWAFYDDEREEHCDFPIGSWAEALWQRCALFLDTSLEYEWGNLSHHNEVSPIIAILTGDIFRVRKIRARMQQGEYAVWPFIRGVDFEAAKEEFGNREAQADDKIPEVQREPARRATNLLSNSLVVLQTVAFLAAPALALYSIVGHKSHWQYAGFSFAAFLGIGFLMRLLGTRFGSRHN